MKVWLPLVVAGFWVCPLFAGQGRVSSVSSPAQVPEGHEGDLKRAQHDHLFAIAHGPFYPVSKEGIRGRRQGLGSLGPRLLVPRDPPPLQL